MNTSALSASNLLWALWFGTLACGLYLGVFRSMIDRIRAGLSPPPANDTSSGKVLDRLLLAPNHERPFHVESALLSALQLLLGFLLLDAVLPKMTGPGSPLLSLSLSFLAERFFSGILPRCFASGNRSSLHLKIGFPMVALARALAFPFSFVLHRLESVFASSSTAESSGKSEENEVADHIRTLAREGSNLDPEVAEIVGNTLEMGQLKVRDVMVSRKQVQILDATDSLERNLEIARSCGHTRLPLCEGDLDHCLGIIHVKHAFRLLGKEPLDLSLKAMTRAPARVSPEESLPIALRKMMLSKVHMALVGDEFGGIDGVITLEDVLEEVVGEIQDEFDSDEKDVEKVNEASWKISGLTPLHELPDELGIDEEEEDVASFGGLITREFGKIPEPSETLRMRNLDITVLQADDTSVILAEVRLINEVSEEEANG